MKCSLLTLSTFIDDALEPDRTAEVDAHLVGCPRCSAGVATLREERDRVGSLARVRVDWESAQSLLEQVGIGATTGPAPVRRETPAPRVAPPRPGRSAGGGAALPWTPQRPPVPAIPSPAITEETNVQTVSPDVQPDLPFDAPRPDSSVIASPEVEALGHPSAGAAAERWGTDLDDAPAAPLDDWEAAIPAYEEPDTPYVRPVAASQTFEPAPSPVSWADPAPVSAATSWDEPPAWQEPAPQTHEHAEAPAVDVEEMAGVITPEPLTPATPAGPPQRLERATGPRALFHRARDLVSVRVALMRPHTIDADADLDTMPPVAYEPLTPIRPSAPIRGFEEPDVAAALPVAPPITIEPAPVAPPRPVPVQPVETAAAPVELSGAPSPYTPASARADAIRALQRQADEQELPSGVPHDWNAFGGAAYQAHAEEQAPARQRVGRHVKQVRKQPVPLRARVAPVAAVAGRVATVVASGAGSAARALTGVARSAGTRAATLGAASTAARTRSTAVSPRVLAAAGAAVVVFLLALFVGRGGTTAQPTTGTGSHTAATGTSAAQGTPTTTQSAPATSAPSTTTTTAPLTGVQTFGGGAAGLSVDRVRYGVFNGSQRLVFDLTGTASGAPSTTIGFSDPTTLLITFASSTAPPSWTAPPSGVVMSITTVSTSKGSVTVRLTLARAATPVAFYLTGPERFVIDLH